MIGPPFKTFAAAVFASTLMAFQAGEVATELPPGLGPTLNLVLSTLASLGAFTFLRKWWERRQSKLDREETLHRNEVQRLRHDLVVAIGYSNRAFQAARSAGVEIEPPPPITPPATLLLAADGS